MQDQAQKLRMLVESAEPILASSDDAVPMVVVSGAQAGVGATTVALNLAAVLADRGTRVLLVDGAQQRSDANESASGRQTVENGLAEVLAGKCEIGEALVTGPMGVRMLLNRSRGISKRGMESSPRRIFDRRDLSTGDFSRTAHQQLMSELQSLGDAFDLLVVDAGRGLSSWSQRFWSRAALVAVVTTPEAASVLAAYTMIKQSATESVRLPMRLVVNQADSEAAADDVHRGIDKSCRRFLSRSMPALPALPRHHAQEYANLNAAPRVWEIPNTPFGHAALWQGRAVSDCLDLDAGNVGQAVPDGFACSVA